MNDHGTGYNQTLLTPLVVETDIGRDADDLFALLYFLGIKAPLQAICVTPGDHDQVAVVKALLKHFDLGHIPVLTLADGTRYKLSPFSVPPSWTRQGASAVADARVQQAMKEFEQQVRWTGSNDVAYREFLRYNQLHDEDSFSDEALVGAIISLTETAHAIDWSRVYGDGEDA